MCIHLALAAQGVRNVDQTCILNKMGRGSSLAVCIGGTEAVKDDITSRIPVLVLAIFKTKLPESKIIFELQYH